MQASLLPIPPTSFQDCCHPPRRIPFRLYQRDTRTHPSDIRAPSKSPNKPPLEIRARCNHPSARRSHEALPRSWVPAEVGLASSDPSPVKVCTKFALESSRPRAGPLSARSGCPEAVPACRRAMLLPGPHVPLQQELSWAMLKVS